MFDWIQHFARLADLRSLNIGAETHLGGKLNFLCTTTLKILILLFSHRVSDGW